ncbi:MAG TPA: hypothetical protein VGH63_08265 [Polyangia bacterium]
MDVIAGAVLRLRAYSGNSGGNGGQGMQAQIGYIADAVLCTVPWLRSKRFMFFSLCEYVCSLRSDDAHCRPGAIAKRAQRRDRPLAVDEKRVSGT